MSDPNEQKKRILLVDDEDDLREMIEYQFRAKGYEVISAQDGIEGLKKLPAANPHLILLDLNMPRMGGIEFYQKICGANGRPSHPILVLTARANTRQLFMEFEVDGFVTKPFEINELMKEADIIIKNYDKKDEAVKKENEKKVSNLFIVDNNNDELSRLSLAFLNRGYKVSIANSGLKAIEKMGVNHTDVALVHLGLVDIPGDIVILRLMRMSKTSDVKFILYLRRNDKHHKSVIDKMNDKSGVMQCLEYTDIEELFPLVDKIEVEE